MRVELVGDDSCFDIVLNGRHVAEVKPYGGGYRIEMHADGASGVCQSIDDCVQAAVQHLNKISKPVQQPVSEQQPGILAKIKSIFKL